MSTDGLTITTTRRLKKMTYQEIKLGAENTMKQLERMIMEMERQSTETKDAELRDMFLRLKKNLMHIEAEITFSFSAMSQYVKQSE